MAPLSTSPLIGRSSPPRTPTKASMTVNADIVEAWAEGFQVGGLVILMLIVICNLKRNVLLHKLILLEQFLATWKGVVIFFSDPVYGWQVMHRCLSSHLAYRFRRFLSSTVFILYISYFLHNYISWLKIRPFLEKRSSIIYLTTLVLVQPYWAVATWTNFENFNGLGHNYYRKVRPWESFAREPWWVFTTCYLVYILKTRFDCGFFELIRSSPRFGIMIFCMLMSVAFLFADFASVWANLHGANGLNPFWRLALVFKCASDTIFLDDFKRVFDVLGVNAIHRQDSGQAPLASGVSNPTLQPTDARTDRRGSAGFFKRSSVAPMLQLRKDSSNEDMAVNSLSSPSSPSRPPMSYEKGRRHSNRNQSIVPTEIATSIAD